MQLKKALAGVLTPVLASVAVGFGLLAGKLHLIGPTPGIFFVLGVFATLSIGGVFFGVWDARRIVRMDNNISDER